MPLYKDNANNRRLKRVGKGYGKECSPCEPKSKSASKPAPAPKPVKKAPAPKPVKKASDKKPKKEFKTPFKGEIFSDNIKTPVKKAPVKKAPAPKTDVEEKELTKETSIAILKKLNSIKGNDFEKLLNFNGDKLEKYSNRFYGAQDWTRRDGIRGAKIKFMKVINEKLVNPRRLHSDKDAIKILNLLDNFKTSFDTAPAPAPAPAPKPVKKAPVKKAPVKKAPVKQLSVFESVKNPKDITSSGKIKRLIKDFLGKSVDSKFGFIGHTIKMPNADQRNITNKALISISSFIMKDVETAIKKYNEFPKNIKDNLGLSIYGYQKEMHDKYKSLKVASGKDGPFYRFYNP